MSGSELKDLISAEVDRLGNYERNEVLEFARRLRSQREHGIQGRTMAGHRYGFSKDDLDQIEKAIEEDCEKIDYNEW